jgi:DNA-binding transcriptional ArsR family regulator
MARSAITSDVFNAVAEPPRRRILNLPVQGERPVNNLAYLAGIRQTQGSKQLRVLRELGLVSVRVSGPLSLYKLYPGPPGRTSGAEGMRISLHHEERSAG